MKKDYYILILFLAITLVSGAIILMIKAPPPQIPTQPQGVSEADMKEHIDHLETLLADDPGSFDILVNLGNAYYDINEPEKSIEYYEKALAIEPDSPHVLVDCGAMYRQLGSVDKAIEMFERAIDIDPRLPQAYFNLGAILRMEAGDAVGAALAWKKYLELDPDPDPRIKSMLENEIESALGAQTE